MGYLKLFVLVGVIFSSRTNGLPDERVVNGTPAVAGQFPFMVFLEFFAHHPVNLSQPQGSQSIVDRNICSSSLIKPNIVLTAAHCIYNLTVFWLSPNRPNYALSYRYAINFVGNSKALDKGLDMSDFYRLDEYILHPFYNERDPMNEKNQYDIALITLPVPVNYPNNVITLLEFPIEGPAPAIAIGFGRTIFDLSLAVMKYGNLTIQKRGTCQFNTIYLICAVGTFQSTCHGDSGGPLVIYRNDTPYQIGVASFGRYVKNTISCSNSELPQGFVSVAEHYNWINTYANIKIPTSITNQAPLVHSIVSLIVYTIAIQISLNNLI